MSQLQVQCWSWDVSLNFGNAWEVKHVIPYGCQSPLVYYGVSFQIFRLYYLNCLFIELTCISGYLVSSRLHYLPVKLLAQLEMMSQSETMHKTSFQPDKDALLENYLGKSLETLRTPAMIIDRRLFAQNCSSMHLKAREWGASFRAHLKTHKVGLDLNTHRNEHWSSHLDCWRNEASIDIRWGSDERCHCFYINGSLGRGSSWPGSRSDC